MSIGPEDGLAARTVRGVAVTVAERWGARLVSAVVFVVLARLLDAEAFGLVALASVFVALSAVLVEQGVADALVQRAELMPLHVSTALGLTTALGVTLTIGTLLLAGPVSVLVGDPGVAPVLRYLSVTFIFTGPTSVAQALLRRNMRFSALSVANFSGVVVGAGVGVGLALSGAGVLALVAQQVTMTATTTVLVVRMAQFTPRMTISRQHLADLAPFSSLVLGNRLLALVNRRSDDLLVGWILGAAALGVYSVAYRLLLLMTELLLAVGMQVTVPAMSRIQDDPPRLARALMTSTRLSAVVAFPAFLLAASLAPEVISVVFGPEWSEAAPVMRVLSLVGVVHAINHFHPGVFLARGRPGWMLGVTAVHAIANLIAFAVTVRWGIVAVATGYVVRAFVITPWELVPLRRLIPLDARAYLGQFAPPLLASVIAALTARALADGLAALLPVPGTLAVSGGLAMAGYLLALQLLAPALLREVFDAVRVVLGGTRRGQAM